MKIAEPSASEVMDYRGLSVYLKVAYGTLRHWVMKGKIPCIKIGSNVRFDKKRIDEWLAENSREPETEIRNEE
jgi:excisionase family DNA binding protein